jgi:hypothetical protein
MNHIQQLGAVFGGIALLTQLAWAENPSTPARPELPALPSRTSGPQDRTPPEPPEPPEPEEVETELRIRREDPSSSRRSVEKFRDEVHRSVSDAMNAAQREVARAKAEITRARKVRTFSNQGGRTLVLPSAGSHSADPAEIHEDLAVMARIFGKAASKSGKNQREFAFRFGEGRDLDGLYLGGFGALFFVSVDWPVTAVPEAEAKKTTKPEETDAVWEKERRKLRSGRPNEEDELELEIETTEDDSAGFDPEKVEGLKERLSAAFRHAANLRGVKDSEEIVVIVLGKGHAPGGQVRGELFGGGPGSALIMGAFGINESGGTTLTFRARKADIVKMVSAKASDSDLTKAVKVEGTPGLLGTGSQRTEF